MEKIIWQNVTMDKQQWIDSFKEYCEENNIENNESNLEDYMFDINNIFLDDIRYNLDVILDRDIIAIADLGLWNGRKQGYKIMGNNIKNCLYTDCDFAKWYTDGKDFKAEFHHHDGTNYIRYRVVKKGVNITKLLNKLYNNEATEEDIKKYTSSLKNTINKIYSL